MGLREVVQENQHIAIIVALVIIGFSIFKMVGGGGSTAVPTEAYFYDVGTGELFTADRTLDPPIDAPSGAGNGVRALVYSCGDCNGDKRIAYLTTHTEEAKQALKEMQEIDPEEEIDPELDRIVERGTLIAAPPEGGGEPQWVLASSEEGGEVAGDLREACPEGQRPVPCFPGM